MIYWPSKPAPDIRPYGLDWGPLLAKLGDPVVTDSDWSRLSGTAIADANGSIDPDGQRVYTTVTGGTANAATVFRNTVALSNGQVWSVDVFLKVRA